MAAVCFSWSETVHCLTSSLLLSCVQVCGYFVRVFSGNHGDGKVLVAVNGWVQCVYLSPRGGQPFLAVCLWSLMRNNTIRLTVMAASLLYTRCRLAGQGEKLQGQSPSAVLNYSTHQIFIHTYIHACTCVHTQTHTCLTHS